MTVIDGAFRVGRVCYKQRRNVLQSSHLTRVRLWTAVILQTLWSEIKGRST